MAGVVAGFSAKGGKYDKWRAKVMFLFPPTEKEGKKGQGGKKRVKGQKARAGGSRGREKKGGTKYRERERERGKRKFQTLKLIKAAECLLRKNGERESRDLVWLCFVLCFSKHSSFFGIMRV